MIHIYTSHCRFIILLYSSVLFICFIFFFCKVKTFFYKRKDLLEEPFTFFLCCYVCRMINNNTFFKNNPLERIWESHEGPPSLRPGESDYSHSPRPVSNLVCNLGSDSDLYCTDFLPPKRPLLLSPLRLRTSVPVSKSTRKRTFDGRP